MTVMATDSGRTVTDIRNTEMAKDDMTATMTDLRKIVSVTDGNGSDGARR